MNIFHQSNPFEEMFRSKTLVSHLFHNFCVNRYVSSMCIHVKSLFAINLCDTIVYITVRESLKWKINTFEHCVQYCPNSTFPQKTLYII